MGHEPQIHDFLHRRRSDQSEPGLSHCHDILVVSKNGKCMTGNGPGSDMKHPGQHFPDNLIHVWNHEQEALRSRKSGGQRTGCQGTMHGRRRPGF